MVTAVIESPSTGDDPYFLSAAECGVLFAPPLRRAALSEPVQKLLDWNHKSWCWGGVSTNVPRARLAFERAIGSGVSLPSRPGLAFLIVGVIDDWRPPRIDVWGDAGFRLRSVRATRNAWPDSITRCPPISVQAPHDESPTLAGIPSAISYVQLVAKDLREVARPRRRRRADNKAYRAALFPATWTAADVRRGRRSNREWASKLPTRRK